MSKKSAYKFMTLSGTAEQQEKVDTAYVLAFQKGYSVVEMARVIGVKSASYIHATLVKRGEIPRGKSGKQKKNQMPKGFGLYLYARSITYAQWCAGWHFDQEAVATEVLAGAGPAMAAIKRDFPGFYTQLTGIPVKDFAKGPPFVASRPEIRLSWDEHEDCFKAEIPVMGVICYESNYQNALRAILNRHRNQITIQRLEALPALGRMHAIW